MDPSQTRARSQPAPTFEDGFGRRQQVTSAGKDPVEVLVLKRELLAVPGFEAAIRERIDQVSRFQHQSFARVRGLARLAKSESGLVLVSDRVEGTRLSELLAPSQSRTLDQGGALMLIGQLLDAVAAFHEAVPGCLGALAPERVIVRPDGQAVIVDHVFGNALPKLSLRSPELWGQLQIATAPDQEPAFDQQTDIVQVGSIALALLLGRPLGASYPNRVGTGSNPMSLSAALERLPEYVAKWVSRAIQRRGHEPFSSSSLARDAFAPALLSLDRVAARRAVVAFYSGAAAAATPGSRPDAAPVIPVSVPEPIPQSASTSAPAAPDHHASMDAADDVKPVRDDVFVASGVSARVNPLRRFLVPMTRRTIAVAAGILMLLTTGGAFAAKRYFTTAAPIAKGTLTVTTNPAGANVVVDGQQRGHAPMTVELAAGEHVLQVSVDGSSSRTIPFKVAPGADVSQVIDLPKVVAATGQLQIRTEPSGARVIVDGQKRGASPLTVEGLMPGAHMVSVEGPGGPVTQEVTIESGATAALVVPLATQPSVPASGWISVTSPIDVQIFEKGQLLGSNRSDKIMASVGRHDLDLTNDALGFRVTRSITVVPGQVSSMKVDAPKGSMSLNAVPWAEVWIDGERIGETPIGNVQVTIGPHEVVFRHPDLGEQRFTPTVSANAPVRVSADLRRKP